ncbi:MFS transporter [Pseudonocardia sp. RS010]|uniref:MFS transporter n=1 Tax=Pseudonocardia sp. RS010 TaxID=3385979 RepID=UPI0039A353FF
MSSSLRLTGNWLVLFTVCGYGTITTPLWNPLAHRFGFGASTITLLFATFAVGVLAALLLLGGISDVVGRRATVAGALVIGIVSALWLAFSTHLAELFAARLLQGLCTGLVAPAATAGLVDLASRRDRTRGIALGSTLVVVATLGGLGSGALVGAIVAVAWADPFVAPFLVSAVMLTACVALLPTFSASGPSRNEVDRRAVVRRPRLPPTRRGSFLVAGTAGFLANAVFAFFAATLPAILAGDLGSNAVLMPGTVLFVVFACAALGQVVLGRRVEPTTLLVVGSAVLLVGIACLALAVAGRTSWALVPVGAVCGLGAGCVFMAGSSTSNSLGRDESRGSVASAFLACAYLGMVAPTSISGVATDRVPAVVVVVAFAACVCVLLAVISIVSALLGHTERNSGLPLPESAASQADGRFDPRGALDE